MLGTKWYRPLYRARAACQMMYAKAMPQSQESLPVRVHPHSDLFRHNFWKLDREIKNFFLPDPARDLAAPQRYVLTPHARTSDAALICSVSESTRSLL